MNVTDVRVVRVPSRNTVPSVTVYLHVCLRVWTRTAGGSFSLSSTERDIFRIPAAADVVTTTASASEAVLSPPARAPGPFRVRLRRDIFREKR